MVTRKFRNGKEEIFPNHTLVQNWVFKQDEECEAILANAVAAVAEKNLVSANDLSHLFPAILRMLKSKIDWAK